MTGQPVVIDMMALADLGQPGKLALEIHRQLRIQFGSVPARVPLEGIAKAVGIIAVEDVDVDQFDGTIVIENGVGAIGLRRGLLPGRRNFTLGHEIGHFLVPTHRMLRREFKCTKNDISPMQSNWGRTKPKDHVETEANDFSSALLLPAPEYKEERRKLGKGSDVSHLRILANKFGVSQEMLASFYVRMESDKAAIIISHRGNVKRVIPCSNFPYLGLAKDRPLPSASRASTLRNKQPGALSGLQEVPTHAWLERKGNVSALYEQSLVQSDGWITTLLTVDEDEPDDEEDDRNWNRKNRAE